MLNVCCQLFRFNLYNYVIIILGSNKLIMMILTNCYIIIQVNYQNRMQEDLLILKLLKLPVIAIKYICKAVAILTYLPNYLLIYILDCIIFNESFISSLRNYILSWPLRFASLGIVIAIFVAEFYAMYMFLSISHFHWGMQILLTVVAFQALLALMRHGYLTMIQKFSPKKLKSPKQHLVQLWYIVVDMASITLTIINMALIINIPKTLSYPYTKQPTYRYIRHIATLIRQSMIDLIKLFYIRIFFRVFHWRFRYAQQELQEQEHNILQLLVLLNVVSFFTILDIVVFVIFGLYCVLHPRRGVYLYDVSSTHEKYKPTLAFVWDSIIQLLQCIILIFCLPFKYTYAKNLLKLVLSKQNNYSFHYIQQTWFVLKLTLVKIPSIVCELFLLLSVYKHRKIAYSMKKQNTGTGTDIQHNQPIFKSKFTQKQHKNTTKPTKQNERVQRQYIVLYIFAQLVFQMPTFPIIVLCTVMKPWNVGWVRYLVDGEYNMRLVYVFAYMYKNIRDYIQIIPCILSIITLGFYNPLKQSSIISKHVKKRSQLKQSIPYTNTITDTNQLIFYNSISSITDAILRQNMECIRKDILFLPLFVGVRVLLLSAIGCTSPKDSVEVVEDLLVRFYRARTKYYTQYNDIYAKDVAAGMINDRRQTLRFWKFAYKSYRHTIFSKFICLLLPRKLSEKIMVNVKIQRRYSGIANHYWHKYNTTIALLQGLLLFIIQLIVTLIGFLIFLPLTLWRMPTFLILYRMHGWKRKTFFPIIFKTYRQMAIDLLTLLPRLVTFILFPRASMVFYVKNSFRYTRYGMEEFEHIQTVKFQFVMQRILGDGLKLWAVIWKIVFVKLLWVRKRDMNQQLSNNNIKISKFIKDYLTTSQTIPNIEQLTQIYPGFKSEQQITQQKQQQIKQINKSKFKFKQQKYKKNSQEQDINKRGLQIDSIVSVYVRKTKDDIPYLCLMVFLIVTLPWRLYYIKNALFLLRDDENGKKQFIRLVRTIAKDYQCIVLYVLLILSGVKTKRALQLFYRNFKINFYVGVLKYSHLQQLRTQLKQALLFYYNIVLIIGACVFGPYRILQIVGSVRDLYRKYKSDIQLQEKNKKMYENTIKQGKSLQILTQIGHNSLMHVCRFLNAKQLSLMTQVSKYMYQSIKQRDQVWMQQWQKVFSTSYPNFKIVTDVGNVSYQAMCVQKYKINNEIGEAKKDSFGALALYEFQQSTFQTQLDLKRQLLKILPQSISDKLFNCIPWEPRDGFGPQQNWPRADDNPELLQLMGIQRRQPINLSQSQAALYLFIARPVQFFIVRLTRFYAHNTHRRKKQLLFLLTTYPSPLVLLACIYGIWDWFWLVSVFFGYKFLVVVYVGGFLLVFAERYRREYSEWTSLHPFDIKDDFIRFVNATKMWFRTTSIKVSTFVKDKFKKYIVRPIKAVIRFIDRVLKWIGGRIKYYSGLFIEKVAKPLYISITHKIQALWILLKNIFKAFVKTIKIILSWIRKLLVNVYEVMRSVVKSFSNLYSNTLEYTLRLALRFGAIGQLIFTVIGIVLMVSPSIVCYLYYSQRWFVIFSTLMTMVLIVTGYKHLNRMKIRVLSQIKGRKV